MRYVDSEGRFEFRYPERWVQDKKVFMDNADAAYARRSMDPLLASLPSRRPARSGVLVGFGPPGGDGSENLSLVSGPLRPGFSLRGTLGAPDEAARQLLADTIAKEGVREPSLLGATERRSDRSGRPLYQFEYRVDFPGSEAPPAHFVCVVGATESTLFTLNARVPQPLWDATRAAETRQVAESFALVN